DRQAGDGIRDFHVTGVQTCALPIYDGSEADHDAALRGDQRSQLVVERLATAGVDPAGILRLEMEAARARGDPDFTRDTVAVDDEIGRASGRGAGEEAVVLATPRPLG